MLLVATVYLLRLLSDNITRQVVYFLKASLALLLQLQEKAQEFVRYSYGTSQEVTDNEAEKAHQKQPKTYVLKPLQLNCFEHSLMKTGTKTHPAEADPYLLG